MAFRAFFTSGQTHKIMMSSNNYQDGGHTIIQGDSLEVLRHQIEDQSVDLVFLDPPYNIGKRFSEFQDKWKSDEQYLNWIYPVIDECIRVLKPQGTLYLMASTQAMPCLDIFIREKMAVLSRIVWHYDSSGLQAKKYFGSLYEPILHCVKDPKNYVFNSDSIKVEAKTGAKRKLIDYRKAIPTQYSSTKVPGNVWCFPRVRYRMAEYENHPSQKPESLLNRMILASSHEGGLILDPFAGTFTCGAVAKQLGRLSISIESQDPYVEIGLRRVLGWTEYQGKILSPPAKNYQAKPKETQKKSEFIQGSLF